MSNDLSATMSNMGYLYRNNNKMTTALPEPLLAQYYRHQVGRQ